MKRLFLLTLGLVLGFSAFAQIRASKDAKDAQTTAQKPSAVRVADGSEFPSIKFDMPQSVVTSRAKDAGNYEEFETMITNYDLQSNSALGNRIAVWPDGTAAFTATWDYSGDTGYPDRGTGYNYYDGEEIGEMPEARVEGDLKTGWPTIAAIGDGEILASHGAYEGGTSTYVYYRETKGEGEWTVKTVLSGVQWPRIGITGSNNEYVHVFGANSSGQLFYARSTDGGDTWGDVDSIPLVDNNATGMYQNQIGADDYVVATNGDNIAVLFGGYTYEVFYIISHDNGETWEKQVVAPWCEEGMHSHEYDSFPTGTRYKMITDDNSHSIAIDDNGVVHVVFALFRWRQKTTSQYTYWPASNFGILYWNSNYVNEQGTHEIPLMGQWSGDTIFADTTLYDIGDSISYSLDIDRVDMLCNADGGEHLRIFGYPLEIDTLTGDTCKYVSAHYTSLTWHYRSYGFATLPGISVDNQGNIAVIYSRVSLRRYSEDNNLYYRSAFVSYKSAGMPWQDDAIELSEGFDHSYDEVYSTTASARAYDGVFWMLYSADENQGLYLDKSDTYQNSNGGTLTDNTLYAIRLTPHDLAIHENEAINPMTTVRAYPNPATDVINLEINASMASEMNVNIYSITGQKVMSKTINVGTGINTTQINVNELESGVYFCAVNANGFNKTVKIIVK